MRYRPIYFLVAVVYASSLPLQTARADEAIHDAHEVVITGHPLTTQVGLDVLRKGGNAADALIAVSLSLGVTEPGNSGLGGKIVLLYYDAKTKVVSCVVAMDAGPLHATADKLKSLLPEQHEKGWTSACTPGLASALGEIQKRWATRPWAELCQPAIQQAEQGVKIIPTAAVMFTDFKPNVDAEATRLYAPYGKTLQVGTIFKNPDLAHTLQILAAKGPQAFYEGEIAEKLVAASQKGGGFLTLEDLQNYHARVVEPLKGSFEQYAVYSSPPPLEGGATVLAALKCLDQMDWTGAAPRNAKYIDSFSRVMQQIYPQVSHAAADVADSSERVGKMLDDHSIDQTVSLAKAADPHSPFKTKSARVDSAASDTAACFAEGLGDASTRASTTHLVIIDKMGNIVCSTQSLGLHFGSASVATGTGVLMNADVSNFSLGSPKSVNYFAPGKWPRSTMSPTMFFEEGKPHLIIGSPAGGRIPNLVLQVSLDVLKFGVPLKQAIEAPRFHIASGTGGPANVVNHIDIEPTMPEGLEKSLDDLGWQVARRQEHDFYFGSVNAALDDAGVLYGVADQRRTSDAGGD